MAGVAIRRLMRGEDGSIRVALVDLATLQEVADAQGYSIVEPDNGLIEDVPIAQQPKSAQVVAQPGEVPADAKTINDVRIAAGTGKQNQAEAAKGMSAPTRDATNNFGYKDKPKGLGLASAIPGPIGMVGKTVNAAWNANNLAANNKARSYLGLPERSTLSNINGVVSDVGNVVSEKANIGGNDYQIGFGGISEDGKHTQLTPDEARTRSMVLDSKIKEGEVSPRGYSLRPASETSLNPSVQSKGTLGQNSYSETGTKRGMAGSLGGIQPQELGTVPDAATPESMKSMKDISAPLGFDKAADDEQASNMTQAQAGKLGGVPAKSVESKSVSMGAPNTSLGTMNQSFDRSFGYSKGAINTATNKATVNAGQAMSPSSFSALGLGREYSPEDRTSMAKTLAGELNGKTLKGLINGEPEALAEAAAVLGTIDNRVNSSIEAQKPNPVASAQRPSQYNANMTKALPNGTVPAKVRDANYKTYGDILEKTVADYTAGTITSPAPDATHYANMAISSPAWGKNMIDAERFGPHTFGTPDQSYKSAVGYGTAYGPVSGVTVNDAVGQPSDPTSQVGIYGGNPTSAFAGPSGQTKNSAASNALSSGLGLGGGYINKSDVGISGVSASDKARSFGGANAVRSGLGVSGSSATSKSGVSGGLSGSNSPRGTGVSSAASTGGRVGTGGFSGGTASMGGRVGSSGSVKSGPSSASAGSNSPRGMGNSSLGGSTSSSSSGSASSSKSDSRGGMSSGRGMGGFN